MKQQIGSLLAAMLILSTLSCGGHVKSRRNIDGSWKIGSKTLDVGSFTQISIPSFSDHGDLYIEAGNKPALRIEADDNILPYITAQVENGTLVLGSAPGIHLAPRRRIKYCVIVTDLEGISAMGWGNVFAPDLKSKRFSLVTGGTPYCSIGAITASEVIINPGGPVGSSYTTNPSNVEVKSVYAEKLKVQSNSNNDVCIGKGKVQQLEVIINHEGNYKAPNVENTAADVRMNGEGSATVRVDKSLNAYLIGALYRRRSQPVRVLIKKPFYYRLRIPFRKQQEAYKKHGCRH